MAADTAAAILSPERLALFEAGGPVGAQVTVARQPTRLFGHSIADLVALSNIAGLIAYEDVGKFDAALDLLARDPVRLGFRVETDPATPRFGMLSVRQPQLACRIARAA